jgi:hypothetical protein
MNSTDLLLRFRSEVGDESRPYLWTDDDIFAYAASAQINLCRLPLRGIADATSVATIVPVIAGEPFSPLHPSVLEIRGATLRSTGRQIETFNYGDVLSGRVEQDFGLRIRTVLSDDVGPIRSAVLGVEDGKLRWNGVPEVDDEVKLVIYRQPFSLVSDHDQVVELIDEHLDGLLLWMKHRAYGKQDGEAFDRTKSEEFLALFVAYQDYAAQAQRRKLHKPRLIQYGGI